MDESKSHLSIKLDGPSDVPLDAFLRVMNGMSEVASEVDRALGNNKRRVRWEISGLEYGSAELIIAPKPIQFLTERDQQQLPRIIREGLNSIQSRNSQRPVGFTDKALRALRGVVETVPKNFQLIVANEQVTVNPNMETVAQIEVWLGGRYEAMGSIEGRLETISAHNKLQFTIYDRAENRIECHFPENLKAEVKQALYEHVAITGRVIYRADGVPVAVQPTEITPLDESQQFPRLEDMIGILDLGMPSEVYVRGLRDE